MPSLQSPKALALTVVAGFVTAAVAAASFQHELLIDSRGGVRLRWTLSETELQMQMEAAVSGYVAVGWTRSGGMSDSFVAFGSAEAAPLELLIASQDSSGISAAPDHPLYNATASTTGGLTTMTFSRAIQHATRPIPIAADTDMIWAVHATYRGSARHTAQGVFVVNLSTGASHTKLPPLLVSHGILMFVAFVIVFPVGVLWARFRDRAETDRISRHKQMQLSGALLALVAFVAVVIFVGSDVEHFEGLHGIAGLLVIIVLVLQILVAPLRPEFGSALRRPWQLFHIWAGRLLFLAAPLVAIIGAALYRANFGAELAALFYLGIVVTIALWALGLVLAVKERRDAAAPSP